MESRSTQRYDGSVFRAGACPRYIEQTGTGVRREIPRNRTGTEEDRSREEPAPADWVNSTVAPSPMDNKPMMAPIQRRVTGGDTVGFDEIPLT